MKIVASFAGVPIQINLLHAENIKYFSDFLSEEEPVEVIGLMEEEIRRVKERYPSGTAEYYVEFQELSYRISETLTKYERCVFHGTAFVWKDKAWILTAPSGTGKTTQYFLWKRLLKEEIAILNGDKPILHCGEERITVHSSPWKGKEGMDNPVTAPLGGMICLRQSGSNRVEALSVERSLTFLFPQFHLRQNDPGILCALDMLGKILDTVPVWLLENRGDEESAALMIKTIMKQEEAVR